MSVPQTLGQVHGTMTRLRLPGHCLPRTSRLWDLDLPGSPGRRELSGFWGGLLPPSNPTEARALQYPCLIGTGGCGGQSIKAEKA